MTKSKHTKRALLASSLSVLLCLAMLVGSTFAWFTDSVTSSGNKIQAGTLNIDLLGKGWRGRICVC
jgi:predicted ribosomally synthesized peptide with SipW-like signal peptide